MLTREKILSTIDITVKTLTVPSTIPVWAGEQISIKQLTRGQQDAYLQRQFGTARMKQDRKATQQEFTAMTIYGHDAWLCAQSICDEAGAPLFTEKDVKALEAKSGEFIGWLAKEILTFSNMAEDAETARSAGEKLADDIKN